MSLPSFKTVWEEIIHFHDDRGPQFFSLTPSPKKHGSFFVSSLATYWLFWTDLVAKPDLNLWEVIYGL